MIKKTKNFLKLGLASFVVSLGISTIIPQEAKADMYDVGNTLYRVSGLIGNVAGTVNTGQQVIPQNNSRYDNGQPDYSGYGANAGNNGYQQPRNVDPVDQIHNMRNRVSNAAGLAYQLDNLGRMLKR